MDFKSVFKSGSDPEEVFRKYASHYDINDKKISLKIDHTMRVAENARRIALSLFKEEGHSVELAWLIGLLHDIGRFEQVKRFGTFNDRRSIDHAELGADLLFRDGLIYKFVEGAYWHRTKAEGVVEKAIRHHNKLVLPGGLDDRELLYCRIIRDADKADIFKVLSEVSFFEWNASANKYAGGHFEPAGEYVMSCVREHKLVSNIHERSEFESLIGHGCMAFEIYFPESRRIIAEQGYLDKLLGRATGNEEADGQLRMLKAEIEKEWNIDYTGGDGGRIN